jgi:hypothetical protein
VVVFVNDTVINPLLRSFLTMEYSLATMRWFYVIRAAKRTLKTVRVPRLFSAVAEHALV